MSRIVSLMLLALAVALCGLPSHATYPRQGWPSAHRGDRALGPENSVEAVRALAALGVPLVEVDVRTATDGVLVLAHDEVLPSGRAVAAVSSVGLPRLDEAIAAVRGTRTRLQLDLKVESFAVIDAVVALGGPVIVQCQDAGSLAYLRRRHPGVEALARVDAPGELDAVARWRPEIVQVDRLDPLVVRRVHEMGALVLVKSLDRDDPAAWDALTRAGADIVLTDHAVRYWTRP